MSFVEATRQERSEELIEVRALSVRLGSGGEQREVLRGLSMSIPAGEVTCIIGPSGSGKSLLLKSILGILPGRPGVVAGQIEIRPPGGDAFDALAGLSGLVSCPPEQDWQVSGRWFPMRAQRMTPWWGALFGYVAQNGGHALDVTRTIGASLRESIRLRARGLKKAAVEAEALDWLELLGFSEPRRVLALYPDQLSGGMAQRVVIGAVLARGARAIFADEPTTGLDPAAQEGLLALLAGLRASRRLDTLVLVSHDLGVAERMADRVAVIEEGRCVEQIGAARLFGSQGPTHPRTQSMLNEYRRLSQPRRLEHFPRPPGSEGEVRLRAIGLSRGYVHGPIWHRQHLPVLQGIHLELRAGEIVGLEGVSGSGKSTLARCLAGLTAPDAGQVWLDGEPVKVGWRGRRARGWAGHAPEQVQLLFQPVGAAIHPRMRVEEALWETAVKVAGLQGAQIKLEVEHSLEAMKLTGRRRAYPHELSGGELRRVGLARALLVRPRVLIADEPTAGVDVSLCAGVLELLARMCEGPRRTAILLISHDCRVIAHLADRVVTLEQGVLRASIHSSRGEGGAGRPEVHRPALRERVETSS